ncbi:unnamed protein product [Sphagnum troendelagicum]|uniref:Uncharacterized protein n=1 Tax=Sphagnum troendelagicum TaxID=128251 RepID=A0ABP0T979_9BRYO
MVAVAVVGFFMHAGVARRKKAAGWLAGGWLAHGSLLSIAIVDARVINTSVFFFVKLDQRDWEEGFTVGG